MSGRDTAPSPERLGEPLTATEEAALRDPVYLDKVIGENEVIRRLLATLDAERASRPSEGEAALREALERLADAAAEAVTGPRQFHESAHRQHALSVHIAAARLALAPPVPAPDRADIIQAATGGPDFTPKEWPPTDDRP